MTRQPEKYNTTKTKQNKRKNN